MPNWIPALLIKVLGPSFRTSVYGIVLIAGGAVTYLTALCDDKPETIPNWEIASAAIVGGLALLQARDNKVSSEQAIGNTITTSGYSAPVGMGATEIVNRPPEVKP
jgi:hypothetical protein